MSMSWKKCLAGFVGFALTFSAFAQTRVEYIHTDALGSPVAVTDASGNVIEREVYEPYGSPITHPPSDQPGFTGHVADSQTNLTYMQQRYYDSQVGRFLSVDPITAHSNPAEAFNRYWYGNNNPYAFTDLDGRQANDWRNNHGISQPSITRECNQGNTCYGIGSTGNVKIEESPIRPAGSAAEFIENTYERLARRTSFVASGGVAAGIGADVEATKTTRPWQRDKIGVYKVLGLGAYAGASAKVRVFSWGDQHGTSDGKLKVNPLGYFKVKVGLGVSLGVSTSFNDHGGGSLSITGGGGLGAQMIVKPPATLGWEKEL